MASSTKSNKANKTVARSLFSEHRFNEQAYEAQQARKIKKSLKLAAVAPQPKPEVFYLSISSYLLGAWKSSVDAARYAMANLGGVAWKVISSLKLETFITHSIAVMVNELPDYLDNLLPNQATEKFTTNKAPSELNLKIYFSFLPWYCYIKNGVNYSNTKKRKYAEKLWKNLINTIKSCDVDILKTMEQLNIIYDSVSGNNEWTNTDNFYRYRLTKKQPGILQFWQRQGYYIDAPNEIQAIIKMMMQFPEDVERDGFTIQKWGASE